MQPYPSNTVGDALRHQPLFHLWITPDALFAYPCLYVKHRFLIRTRAHALPVAAAARLIYEYNAVKTYKNIPNDQTLKGLLVLFGSMERLLSSFKVDEHLAYGYDEKGNEIVKVPVTEPMYVREFFDQKLKVYRQNTP